jgi:hypothetical protein
MVRGGNGRRPTMRPWARADCRPSTVAQLPLKLAGQAPHYRTPITERIDLLTFLWVGFWVCPARFPGTVDFVSFYTASCEFRYSVRTSVWCPA